MTRDILDKIYDNKLITIIRGIGSDRILETVGALYDGGVRLLEVTFNQQDKSENSDSLKCLKLIHREYGSKVCMGAGTVLTADQVEKAVDAGAEYIISPNTDINIIRRTKELGKVSIPGAFTPTEIASAYGAGADMVKLFPAGINGIEYIKAILAPLNHIPLVAVGGINVDNAGAFIKAGVKGLGVGGNLVDRRAIYLGEFDKITQVARAYVMQLKEI